MGRERESSENIRWFELELSAGLAKYRGAFGLEAPAITEARKVPHFFPDHLDQVFNEEAREPPRLWL